VREVLTGPFAVAAVVVCVAGLAKLRSPAASGRAARVLGLPGSPGLIRCVAAFEVALGAWCVARPSLLGAGALACLYGLFSVASLVLARRQAACGCFGGEDSPASALQSVVSALLAVAALAAALAPPHGAAWILGHGVLVTATLVIGTFGAAYGIVLVYTAWPQAWGSWRAR
jgi:hypothetical protein